MTLMLYNLEGGKMTWRENKADELRIKVINKDWPDEVLSSILGDQVIIKRLSISEILKCPTPKTIFVLDNIVFVLKTNKFFMH